MTRTAGTLTASIILLVTATGRLVAQHLEPRPVPFQGVESFTFKSPSMGVTFAVNVGFPDGYQPGDGRFPALITTDGDWAFHAVNEAARSVAGAIDPLFVVSIGTRLDEGEATWTRRRIYEFSPPNWDRQDPFGLEVSKFCQGLHSEPGRCTGGAPGFLKVIVSELIPLITAKYQIDPSQLGLFGVSAGGFFASWAIFQPDSPFRKYIISSPAMAYGDGEIFRQEERYAKDHNDLPVGIYMGAGVLETGDGFLEGIGKIVSGMSRLSGILGGRHYPGLKLVTEYHPGMSHTDVMGTSVVRGLRTLYGKRP